MTHSDLTWKYLKDFDTETEFQHRARALSVEHGVEAITASTGAQMAVIVAATGAQQIAEVGTGFGVTGLWLFRGAPNATLTSVDPEFEHHETAREIFSEAGFPEKRVRLITGKPADVLPRMNDNSYDIVVLDGEPTALATHIEHALRLLRTGGTLMIPHVLWHDEVADPANRKVIPAAYRAALRSISEDENLVVALSSVGNGLLQATKR